MKITLLASTSFHDVPDSVMGTPFGDFFLLDRDALLNDADTLSHFAGRSCYQAWEMPNESTRTNMGYLANILKQGHESVLEHGTASFYIEGVSRNLTHELIRHRHLSYSELSQRYVDMEKSNVVVAPALRKEMRLPEMIPTGDRIVRAYKHTVDYLTGLGYKRKEARQAARYDLPGGTETRIVVSGNHRAWRDMLKKRYSVHADTEICELASKLLESLRELAPGIYQDFPDQPFE